LSPVVSKHTQRSDSMRQPSRTWIRLSSAIEVCEDGEEMIIGLIYDSDDGITSRRCSILIQLRLNLFPVTEDPHQSALQLEAG
jgi:hypothetical protein